MAEIRHESNVIISYRRARHPNHRVVRQIATACKDPFSPSLFVQCRSILVLIRNAFGMDVKTRRRRGATPSLSVGCVHLKELIFIWAPRSRDVCFSSDSAPPLAPFFGRIDIVRMLYDSIERHRCRRYMSNVAGTLGRRFKAECEFRKEKNERERSL